MDLPPAETFADLCLLSRSYQAHQLIGFPRLVNQLLGQDRIQDWRGQARIF